MARDKRRYGQDPTVVVRSSKATFNRPLSKSWSSPAMVFTCSWSDFFIEEADAWRPEAWDIIRSTPWLTYQILTKRPERIFNRLPRDWGAGWPHVWLGITAENKRRWDERWETIVNVPARVRFVSFEPLLELVDPGDLEGRGIHWAIVGGESGPDRRECKDEWVTRIVRRCAHAGVACLVKQIHVDGGVVTDPARFPEHLRAREYPTCPA
jgi:protein gp37